MFSYKDLLTKFNLSLCVLPICIFSLGYITLLSSSPEKARSQLIFFLLGYAMFILTSLLDYKILRYYAYYIFGFSFGLLFLTLAMGELKLGSTRWLNVGLLTFQPSEIAKLALVVFLASYLTYKKDVFSNARSFLIMATQVIILMAMVFIQPDLGTTLILVAIFLGMLLFSEFNKLYFFLMFVASALLSTPIWHMLQDYQKVRILVFLNPNLDVLGRGYNVAQALIAIGSGGLWGAGFGRGTQAHLNFLPVHWTDFIFATYAEEWGFVGVMLLLILYVFLLLLLLFIIYKSKDKFGVLLVAGVFFVFLSQFMINVGMNLGLMPVTGVTLPLMSHGGTSTIISLFLLGVAHSVWRHS